MRPFFRNMNERCNVTDVEWRHAPAKALLRREQPDRIHAKIRHVCATRGKAMPGPGPQITCGPSARPRLLFQAEEQRFAPAGINRPARDFKSEISDLRFSNDSGILERVRPASQLPRYAFGAAD
jgi:hypothetical protein